MLLMGIKVYGDTMFHNTINIYTEIVLRFQLFCVKNVMNIDSLSAGKCELIHNYEKYPHYEYFAL